MRGIEILSSLLEIIGVNIVLSGDPWLSHWPPARCRDISAA
jgi:hypothetical protein